MAKLLLVSTPIGNLKDITLRAIETLEAVSVIACEDTRRTGLLLKKLEIKNSPQLFSYFEHNEEEKIDKIINLLREGVDVALISDSGTPLISDPGYKLVRKCLEEKIVVETIPGACAAISALIGSGMPTDKFLFLGFLPQKKIKRERILKALKKTGEDLSLTVIIYESPYKLLKTLKDLRASFGNINLSLARELTKIHEEIKKEKIDSLIEVYSKKKPKGEFVLLFSI
ncbi:MAG: 16S rRNA (cytidine(1402)-2'-O)-methyltransferase [Patescibacteria group bacterium]|nr:16S rRNA (cytidine(1402)-2'-O)-methyltransferase [Patescibacteria group bacterium]